MAKILNLELSSSFRQQLQDDGFQPMAMAWFEILDGRTCRIHFNRLEMPNWEFTLYLFTSFRDRGKAVRIGKSENYDFPKRLIDWECLVGDALSEKIFDKNLKYAGGTPPWEANGWLEYTLPYGLVFAQAVGSIELLRTRERELIKRYDPPMCNDSVTGRMLAKEWRKHSALTVVKKGRGPRRNPHRCPAGGVCPLPDL